MEARRTQIIDAATRILINAPEQFSMRNLANEASVSIRTIYNLIGEQSELLAAIVNQPNVGLLQQYRREHKGSAFDGLLLEIDLIRKMDLKHETGLAIVRALRILDPSFIIQHVKAAIEADYLPDLRQAIEQGDLRDDIPFGFLAQSLVINANHAVMTWALDRDSISYKERVAQGLIMTLLMAATPTNRTRCLALLNGRSASPKLVAGVNSIPFTSGVHK
jgi:AcrR family transcriptional regulator